MKKLEGNCKCYCAPCLRGQHCGRVLTKCSVKAAEDKLLAVPEPAESAEAAWDNSAVKKAVAEARESQRKAYCAAVCGWCRDGLIPNEIGEHVFLGRSIFPERSRCPAWPIHELHHQEQAQIGATVAPDSPKRQNP